MSLHPELKQTDQRTAYSYVRFSSAEQAHGKSLQRQIELGEDYARRHGLRIDTTLKLHDKGVSSYRSKNLRRGALGRFIREIERGRVEPGDTLLVESLDRLSRDQVFKQLRLFSQIIESGIAIVTLGDGKRYDEASINKNPMELMFSIMVMSRAHEESTVKASRTQDAWNRRRAALLQAREKAGQQKLRAKRFQWPILTKRCPGWIEWTPAGFKLIPDRAEVVRRIFRLYFDGKGKFAISRELNHDKVQTWGKSKGWQVSYICKILKSPTVIGDLTLGHTGEDGKHRLSGEVIEGYYPAAITLKMWLKAKAKKLAAKLPRGRGAYGTRVSNLFTGIMYDGHTGLPMHYHAHGVAKNGRYVYFASDAGRFGQPSRWNYFKFEEAFFRFVGRLDWKSLWQEAKDGAGRGSWAAAKGTLESQIAELEKEQDRLLKLGRRMEDPPQALLDEMRSIAKELTLKEAELDQVDTRISSEETSLGTLKDGGTVLDKLLRTHDPEVRVRVRTAIQERVKRIDLYGHGVPPDWEHKEILQPNGWPGFKVTFANDATRWVLVDRMAPERLISIVEPNLDAAQADALVEEILDSSPRGGRKTGTVRRAKKGRRQK